MVGDEVAVTTFQPLQHFPLASADIHTHAHSDTLSEGIGQTILRTEVLAAPFKVTRRPIKREGYEFTTLLNVVKVIGQNILLLLKYPFGNLRCMFNTST